MATDMPVDVGGLDRILSLVITDSLQTDAFSKKAVHDERERT